MEGDGAYFARRAREEYAAAMRAAHLNARSAHIELARRYSVLAREIGQHERAWGIGAGDDLGSQTRWGTGGSR